MTYGDALESCGHESGWVLGEFPMTGWDIGILVLVNLAIACWLFFYWRMLDKDIQKKHPSQKLHRKPLLFWLIGIWLVGIWFCSFIDYSRYVSAPLLGMRLLMIWCVCHMAIRLWQRREVKRIAGKKQH